MAIKKFRFRPEGVNDYSDILHPETSADVVLLEDTAGNFSSNNVEGALAELYSRQATKTEFDSHVNNKNNPHAVTAAQVGAAPASHVGSGGSAHALATASMAGFMSAADKQKLNSLDGTGGVAGVYTGNDAATRTINVGFTPSAVLVLAKGYNLYDGAGGYYGALAINGYPGGVAGSDSAVKIVSGGFQVSNKTATYNTNLRTNSSGTVYHYIALR